jgi:hypothetical protein
MAPSSPARLIDAAAAATAPALVLAQPAPAGAALERAKQAYAEFAKAMDELASNANGWIVVCGERKPHPRSRSREGAFENVSLIH